MKWLFLMFMALHVLIVNGQTEFVAIDNHIINMPKHLTNSTSDIASYISSNYKKEKDRCRAAYKWVTFNIKYATDSMYIFNWGANPERKVTDALRRRKGVCENYAAIFNEILIKCGIQSYVISGYTKQAGFIDKNGHSWCAVNIDGEWLLCDPTWDEGYKNEANYFLVAPALFVETHVPFDPLWQLLDRNISGQSFYSGSLNNNEQDKFYYEDSVKAFLRLTELQQLEATARRIRQAGVGNELTRIWLSYIDMQAGIFYETKDMNDYNAAVADLNKARNFYNVFIEYRNQQFIPARPDAEMNELLPPIEILLSTAEKKLDVVDQSPTNAQYNTGTIRADLINFRTKVQIQNAFLQRYLNSKESDRKKMFYNY